MMATTEKNMVEILATLLDGGEVKRITPFLAADLHKGMVVAMKDGAEFMVTIVQSRQSDVEDGPSKYTDYDGKTVYVD